MAEAHGHSPQLQSLQPGRRGDPSTLPARMSHGPESMERLQAYMERLEVKPRPRDHLAFYVHQRSCRGARRRHPRSTRVQPRWIHVHLATPQHIQEPYSVPPLDGKV